MKIRKHKSIFLAVLLLMGTTVMPLAASAKEEMMSKEKELYLNWMVSDTLNKDNWKKASEVDTKRPGIYEVSIYPPGTEPTPEQVEAANKLIQDTLEAAKRHNWFDISVAFDDGFDPYDPNHFINMDFVHDEYVLNPDRPENLMFYTTPTGPKLVGVMYLLGSIDEHGPQVGGPLTIWHYHVMPIPYCWDVYPNHIPEEKGHCAMGVADERSAEMLHVWFVELPTGPFTTNMTLPQDIFDALK